MGRTGWGGRPARLKKMKATRQTWKDMLMTYDEVEIRIEYPFEKISPNRVKILVAEGREKTVLSSFEWDGDFLPR